MSAPSAPVVPKKFLAIFVMLVSCFTLWGLLNNMTDNLVPSFQRIFTMDQSKAGLVQVAFYGAYAVLAIFAAILAQEFSYRKGVLIGLFVYITGALLYIPACIAQSFDIYFIAIFIVAGGCSLLETTCNPYVLSLGDESTAVRRLNFAQMFNPVGSMMGIVLAQQLILSHLNPATADERALMDEATRQGIIHHELFWVCAPYVGLCAIAALIWLFFLFAKDESAPAGDRAGSRRNVGIAALFTFIPITALYFLFPGMNKIAWVLCGCLGPLAYVICTKGYREMLAILLSSPRYWFGVIAQFFYVGVQIAAWTWLNAYCQKELGVTPADGALYYTIAISLFIICRWVATFLMKYFDPAKMMAVFSLGAILCSFGVMYLPTKVMFTIGKMPFAWNIICLVAMSGFMSLMFPTIYGIALGKLNQKALKLGASGLIMAILGGAIITPWMSDVIGSQMMGVRLTIESSANYASGEKVPAGELFALVWSADGVFEGFAADGQPLDANDQVVRKSPCSHPGERMTVDFLSDVNVREGVTALYLLDTRDADGKPTKTDEKKGTKLVVKGSEVVGKDRFKLEVTKDRDPSLFIKMLGGRFDEQPDRDLCTSSASIRASFVIPAICFAVVGLYALLFRAKKERK